jgi:hypothetical protein
MMAFSDEEEDNDGWENLPAPISSSSSLHRYEEQQCIPPTAPLDAKRQKEESAGTEASSSFSTPTSSTRQSNAAATTAPTPTATSSSRTAIIKTTTTTAEQQQPPPHKKKKTTIISHPTEHILFRFGIELIYELWQNDLYFRLALILLLMGSILRLILYSCYLYFYPIPVLVGLAVVFSIGLPVVAWHYPILMRIWRDVSKNTSSRTISPQEHILLMIEQSLHSTPVRNIILVLWYVLPTVMAMRTYQFLCLLTGTSNTAVATFFTTLAMLYYLRVMPPSQHQRLLGCWSGRTTTTDVVVVGAANDGRSATDPTTDQSLSFGPLYILYGCALMALPGQEWYHLPAIGSQFALASAYLLFQHNDNGDCYWSDTIQRALRNTIRTILVQAQTTVQQDELLQLTMLRWVAEYWASSTSSSGSRDGHNNNNNNNSPPHSSSSGGDAGGGGVGSGAIHHSSTTTTPTTTTETNDNEDNVEWSVLSTMLQHTTEQMAREAVDLQQQQQQQPPPPPHARGSQQQAPQQQNAPPASSSSNNNTTNNNNNTTTTTTNNNNKNNNNDFMSSIEGLQAMFTSMDLDETAKPAVQSYQRLVAAIPPSRDMALVLGLLYRIPATILFVGYGLLAMFGVHYPPTRTLFPLLLPFVVLEWLHVQQWLDACRVAAADTGVADADVVDPADWPTADPMILLLVDRTPTSALLRVWRNVTASVSALEMGLVAARCVQTTAVAADFCANMISLANLGQEVSQHGVLHGVAVVVRELIHLHQTATPLDQLTHGIATPPGASYTSAAVSAVRNSQRLSRNLNVLASPEENNRGGSLLLTVVAPVAAALPLVVGRGWLWGGNGGNTTTTTTNNNNNNNNGPVFLEEAPPDQNTTLSDRIFEVVDDADTSPEDSEQPLVPSREECEEDESPHINNDQVIARTVHRERAVHSSTNDDCTADPLMLADLRLHSTGDQADTVVRPGFFENEDSGSFEAISGGQSLSHAPHQAVECDEGDTSPQDDQQMGHDQGADDEKLKKSFTGQGAGTAMVADGEEEEHQDNLWLKVGAGGLAVVGAVAAFAATHHRLSEEKRRAGRKTD